jgi:hypothetical protein
LHAEQFRPAPDYDFSVPPFAGPLGYKIDPQAPEGRNWRALVQAEFTGASNRAFHRAHLWFAFKKARIKRNFGYEGTRKQSPVERPVWSPLLSGQHAAQHAVLEQEVMAERCQGVTAHQDHDQPGVDVMNVIDEAAGCLGESAKGGGDQQGEKAQTLIVGPSGLEKPSTYFRRDEHVQGVVHHPCDVPDEILTGLERLPDVRPAQYD